MEQCVFCEDSISVLSPLSQYHPTDRIEDYVREAGKVIQVAKKQLWINSQKRQPMRSLHLIFIRRRRCFLPKNSQKTGQWMPINCLCGWPWDLITSEGLSTPTAGKDLVGWNEHLKSNQHEEQDTWGFTSCNVGCRKLRWLTTGFCSIFPAFCSLSCGMQVTPSSTCVSSPAFLGIKGFKETSKCTFLSFVLLQGGTNRCQ